MIRNGRYEQFESRSEAVFYVVNEMLRRGYRAEAIAQVLLDRANRVGKAKILSCTTTSRTKVMDRWVSITA